MYETIKEIVNGCSDLLTKNGYKPSQNAGEFIGDLSCFQFRYDEERTLVILEYCSESNGDYTELGSWLYDGTNPKDVPTIVEDFSDVIAKKLGLKPSSGNTANVVMPTRAAAGSENTVDSLTQKMLAIFPAFKETYKEHVAEKGSFLYVSFFKETVVPELRTQSAESNTKTVTKVMKALAEIFYNCDRTTSDVICGVLIAGAFYDKPDLFDEYTVDLKEEYPCFVTAGKAILAEAKNNKKYREMLAK